MSHLWAPLVESWHTYQKELWTIKLSMLFCCLVFNGTSTQDRSICANCGRVKLTQVAKDGKRETMHNSQYVTQCNTVHNKTLQLQKCNNRRLSNSMTCIVWLICSSISLVPSPIPSRITHSQSGIIISCSFSQYKDSVSTMGISKIYIWITQYG